MAQAIIYANGETKGSSFHLTSEWTGNGAKHTTGPTVASATYTYSLSSLPTGAKITGITVHARIGARFSPKGSYAAGYPKANGISFQQVSGSSDTSLYTAPITFEDASATTKVTYSFKSGGYGYYSGSHSGSVSFDDVYLVVDYKPPCSDWTLSTTSEYVGETIWADVVMTEDNAAYSHKVVVSCMSGLQFTGSAGPGQSRIWIALNSAWMEQFPNTTTGVAQAVQETYDASGSLLGTSEPVAIELLCPKDMIPTPGQLVISGTSMFGGTVYIQGVSSVAAIASGWDGVYGSTIKTVTITGNGKTVAKDFSSGGVTYSDDLKLDAGLLKSDGTVEFILTVTDSRGRTASVTKSISVVKYSPVSILSTSQGRVTNDTVTGSDTGYVRVEYDYTSGISYASGGSTIWNTPVQTVTWGANSKAVNNYASKSQINFAENALSKNQMYTVTLHLTDGITSTTVVRKIGTAYTFMRWDPKNNAVGFGCYPQQSHCVEIGADWTLIVDKDILIQDPAINQLVSLQNFITSNVGGGNNSNIVASATQPDSPTEGMIWLDIS